MDGLIHQSYGNRGDPSRCGSLPIFVNKRLPCLYLFFSSQHFLKSAEGESEFFVFKKSYGGHRNKKCSFCLMREYIPRQVASQLAQIKQNWLAETYQQSRRNNGQVAGPGADGKYLDLQFFLLRVPLIKYLPSAVK